MKTLTLLIAFFTVTAFTAVAEEAPKIAVDSLATLITATQEGDLEKFHSICDDNMKKAVTAAQLKKVTAQITPLMKQGYKKEFLGMIDRGVYKTYMWKMIFEKEGAPELLAELSIIDGKTVGFFIR